MAKLKPGNYDMNNVRSTASTMRGNNAGGSYSLADIHKAAQKQRKEEEIRRKTATAAQTGTPFSPERALQMSGQGGLWTGVSNAMEKQFGAELNNPADRTDAVPSKGTLLRQYDKELDDKIAAQDEQIKALQNQWAEMSTSYAGRRDGREDDLYRAQRAEAMKAQNEAKATKEYLLSRKALIGENLIVFEAAENGDLDLFEDYYKEHVTNQANRGTAVFGQNTGDSWLGSLLAEVAYAKSSVRENTAKNELKKRGYTDEQILHYINARNGEGMDALIGDVKEFTAKHPIIAEAAKVATVPVRGIAGALGMVMAPGEKHTGYSLLNEGARAVNETESALISTTIEATANRIGIQGKGAKTLGKLGTLIYSAADSALESAVAMGTGGNLGEVMLGLSAATDAYNEALDNGLPTGRAITTGVVAGAFETLFEHLSLENLRGLSVDTSNVESFIGKKGFINFLKSAFTEGSEEFFTDIANEAYDYLINGGYSNFQRTVRDLMAEGMSEEKAKKQYARDFGLQLAQDFFVGAMSGGMGFGSRAGVVNARVGAETSNIGRAVRQMGKETEGGVQGVLKTLGSKETEGLNDKSGRYKVGRATLKAFDEYEKRFRRTVKTTAEQAGTENTVKQIDGMLQEAGLHESEAGKVAQAYVDFMTQDKVAYSTLRTIVSNDAAVEYINNQLSGDNYSAARELRNKILETASEGRINQKIKKKLEKWVHADEFKRAEAQGEVLKKSADAVQTGETAQLITESVKASTADGRVQVKGIAGIEDGKITVTVDESGATDDLDNITFDETKDGIKGRQIYTAVADMMRGTGDYNVKMSATAANLVIALAQNTDTPLEVFLQDAYEAYKAGTVMRSRDTVEVETDYAISNKEIEAMYAAGAAEYKVQKGVTRIGTQKMTEAQTNMLQVLDRFFQTHELSLIVVDNLWERTRLKNYRLLGANYTDAKGTDVIVIALNAGKNQENVLDLTAYHELFHWLKKQGPDGRQAAQEMIDGINEGAKEKDADGYREMVDELKEVGYTADEIAEEIACQYMGTLMAAESFRQQTANDEEAAAAWGDSLPHLKSFYDNVRDYIKTTFAYDKRVQAALNEDVDTAAGWVARFEGTLSYVQANTDTSGRERTQRDYSYAGVGSRTANKSMLERARQMENEGLDSEEIRQKTGWFRGTDNQWRYEINDKELLVDGDVLFNDVFGEKGETTLGELIEHDALFAAYPQLKSIPVYPVWLPGNMLGAYTPSLGCISVNRAYFSEQFYEKSNEFKETMIHEIQHAIQDIEGFASGASEKYWERILKAGEKEKTFSRKEKAKLRELMDQYEVYAEDDPSFVVEMEQLDASTPRGIPRGKIDWDTLEKVEEDPPEWKAYDRKREQLVEEYGNKVYDFMTMKSEIDALFGEPTRTARQLYYDTAGEVEARDTADRVDFTAEQRKEKRPDIDRTDVVFAYADVIKKSLAFAESGEHEKLIDEAWTDAATLPKSTATERYRKIIDIWKKIGGNINSEFLNAWDKKVGKDRAFEIFKAQSGYKYNAELASMCKKGIALFDAIDVIVKERVIEELGIEKLGKHEKEILYDILKNHGHEIPCAICYVEQARQREGTIIRDFVNGNKAKKKLGWNEALDKIEERMQAKGITYRFGKIDIAAADYTPADAVMSDVEQNAFYNAVFELVNEEIENANKTAKKKRTAAKAATPQAINAALKGSITLNMRVYKSLVNELQSRYRLPANALYSSVATQNIAKANHELYKTFNMQGGVSGYKTKQTPIVYWGDILKMTDKPAAVRKAGGIRWQSNSDFQMYTFLDRVQYFLDMTAKGYYHQEYTKVPASLKLFGLMRGKQNASLIPAVHIFRNADGSINEELTRENAGLDENGEPIYDKVEGIDPDEAFMIAMDREYSKSVGTICVGYSDNHIWKLLDDERVSMIIGFHDKTDNPEKRYRGARYAHNYNGENEAKNAKGETVHVDFSSYIIKAENKFKKTGEAFTGTTTFNGKMYTADDIPKLAADIYLSELKAKGWTPAYEKFAGHENYYKLLADFRLVDAEGHYAPHRPVQFYIPETVPVRTVDKDGSVRVEQMDTEEYIQTELEKEMRERDAIARDLADESADGIIPQFKKAIREDGTSYSRALDQEYMNAVEAGDEETQERLVEQAAKEAGYTYTAYHGTNQGDFTVFDWNSTQRADAGWYGRGHYFATHRGEAYAYGKRIVDAYLKITRPFVFRDEIYTFDGKDIKNRDIATDNVLFMINMSEKIPTVFGNRSVTLYDNEEYADKTVKWTDLRQMIEDVMPKLILLPYADGHYEWKYDYGLFGYQTHEEYKSEEDAKDNKIEAAIKVLFDGRYDIVNKKMSPEAVYLGADMDASNAFSEALKAQGYDGVLQAKNGDEIVVFDSSQIKSAAPVTYDDEGDVIPLSERFNSAEPDIRYSRVINQNAVEYVERLKSGSRQLWEMIDILEDRANEIASLRAYLGAAPLDRNALRRIAKRVNHSFDKSKAHVESLTMRLEKAQDMLATGANVDTVLYGLYKLAEEEWKNTGHWEVVNENAQEFIDYLRPDGKMPVIYMDESTYSSVAAGLGGRKAFRDRIAGKFVVTTDETRGGTSLDDFYSAARDQNKFQLPETMEPSDQMRNMIELYESGRETQLVDTAEDRNLEGETLAERATDDAFNMLREMLFPKEMVDKARKQLENSRPMTQDQWDLINMTDRLDNLQEYVQTERRRGIQSTITKADEELQKRLEELSRSGKTTVEIEIERDRLKQEYCMEALRRAYAQRIESVREYYKEQAQKEAMRRDIKRNLTALMNLFNKESDSQHVPEVLKKTVLGFLAMFDKDRSLITAANMHRIAEFADEIKDVGEDEIPQEYAQLFGRFDEDIRADINELIKKIEKIETDQGIRVHSSMLSLDDMRVLNNTAEHIRFLVESANEAFVDGKRKKISAIAESIIAKAKSVTQSTVGKMVKNSPVYDFIATKMLTPINFFDEKIGGAMADVYEGFRNGQDEWFRRVAEGKNVLDKAKDKYHYKDWKDKKIHFSFPASLDRSAWEVDMPIEAVLQIYATLERERRSGKDTAHLTSGGVVLGDELTAGKGIIEKLKGLTEKGAKAKIAQAAEQAEQQANANRHQLSWEELLQITQHPEFTKEMKDYADAIVKYMSTDVSKYGNEATMALSGIRKFNEEYYFPFQSAKNYLYTRLGVSDDTRLKNAGFTKRVKYGANTPLVLSGFTSVAANHIQQMALFSTMTVPIDTLQRVINYQQTAIDENGNVTRAEGNVKTAISNAYGKSALSYINTFVTQVNGGIRTDPLDSLWNKGTSMFKRAAVMGNMSVVVQQPTAMMRGMAILDPKYIFGKASKADYKDMLEHAPIAGIKEQGGFDTGTGRGAVAWMLDEATPGQRITELWGKPAAIADAVAWTNLWNGCKRETRDKHPELEYGSDAFYDAVYKRFRDIVDYTQVYDSTLSKNELMRGAGGLTKMVTAFMAEPSLSLNMLMMSGKGRKINKGRALAAFAANIIINSMFKAIVAGWRDKDDDESYSEKWLEHFISDLVGDKNVLFLDGAWSPVGMVPWVKDILSLWQGYNVDRSDISAISDLIESAKGVGTAFDKFDGTWQSIDLEAIADFSGSISAIGPMPMEKAIQDVMGITRVIFNKTVKPFEISWETARQTLLEGMGFTTANAEKAYDAAIRNNTEYIRRQLEPDAEKIKQYIATGNTPSEARTNALVDAQQKWENAVRDGILANDERAVQAAEARYNGDTNRYELLVDEMVADGLPRNSVIGAIKSLYDALKPDEAENKTLTDKSLYTTEDLDRAVRNNDLAAWKHIREELMIDGTSEETITKKVTDYAKELVADGDEKSAKQVLTTFAGMSDNTAAAKVKNWKNPDGLSADAWYKYYDEVASSGISADVFERFWTADSAAKGEDKNGDGKADNGTKKAEQLKIIDSLPITSEQKDVLYRLHSSWGESKLSEAPWH